MITIQIAKLNVGIDNRYDIAPRLEGFLTDEAPDFTVRVTEADLRQERSFGEDLPEDYLEYICAYRHIAEALPAYDGFVMHGAAVVDGDRSAYLFTAPSGTGKTTHVRLWLRRFPGRVWVLNGDKPVIRRIDGRFFVCGTPWRGKEQFGRSAIRPFGGVCLLDRGRENSIAPLPAGQAMPRLMRQFLLPKQPEQLMRFLRLADECFSTTPIYAMACNRSPAAAVMSYEAMTGHSAGPEPELTPKQYQLLHEYDSIL